MTNLLSNAEKYTKKGCITLKAYSEPIDEESILFCFSVTDTGAGIKKEDLERELKNGLAEEAFDDQCTGANPRYPLMSEIKEMYINAFNGKEVAKKDSKKSNKKK